MTVVMHGKREHMRVEFDFSEFERMILKGSTGQRHSELVIKSNCSSGSYIFKRWQLCLFVTPHMFFHCGISNWFENMFLKHALTCPAQFQRRFQKWPKYEKRSPMHTGRIHSVPWNKSLCGSFPSTAQGGARCTGNMNHRPGRSAFFPFRVFSRFSSPFLNTQPP